MPQVKHYGCFEFKAGTTQETIDHRFTSMGKIVGKIDTLLGFNMPS